MRVPTVFVFLLLLGPVMGAWWIFSVDVLGPAFNRWMRRWTMRHYGVDEETMALIERKVRRP